MRNLRSYQILDYVKSRKHCSLEELRERFGVSQATIYRDASALVARGALQRVRRTRSQTALKAEDRLKNVQGVFRLKKPIPEARHVLLVDDTFTTGATLAAGYEAVRTALGEQVRISVATLAVVHA